jgi:hypothetical protein
MNPVSEVSTLRLYLLRGMYAFMFVGLAIVKWPAIFNPPPGLSYSTSVVSSVLLAISLLAVLGIRHPLKMLPLLFFEFLWKAIWVVQWGLLPLAAGELGPEAQDALTSYVVGVVLVPLVLPWRYVLEHYVKAPGERWARRGRVGADAPSSLTA